MGERVLINTEKMKLRMHYDNGEYEEVLKRRARDYEQKMNSEYKSELISLGRNLLHKINKYNEGKLDWVNFSLEIDSVRETSEDYGRFKDISSYCGEKVSGSFDNYLLRREIGVLLNKVSEKNEKFPKQITKGLIWELNKKDSD